MRDIGLDGKGGRSAGGGGICVSMGAGYDDDSDMSGLALLLSIFRIPIDRILPISHLSVKSPKTF